MLDYVSAYIPRFSRPRSLRAQGAYRKTPAWWRGLARLQCQGKGVEVSSGPGGPGGSEGFHSVFIRQRITLELQVVGVAN
jgi:hypothetical protein